jgi:hypothetical protein
MTLLAHLSPGGWTVHPLVAAVHRHWLTPSTWTRWLTTDHSIRAANAVLHSDFSAPIHGREKGIGEKKKGKTCTAHQNMAAHHYVTRPNTTFLKLEQTQKSLVLNSWPYSFTVLIWHHVMSICSHRSEYSSLNLDKIHATTWVALHSVTTGGFQQTFNN